MIVTNQFKTYIYNFIRKNILPNLNLDEFNQIIELYYDLINFVAIRFNIDPNNSENFSNQLKQNNNRDLMALFNLLLPYINDNGGTYNLHKQIYDLRDISIKKKSNKLKDPTKNNFLISNIQLSRGVTNPNYINKYYSSSVNKNSEENYKKVEDIPLAKYQKNMFSKKNTDENNSYLYYEFNMLDIRINYYLLLKTINTISHKLYINWIGILPITWNYKNTSLYRNTYRFIDQPMQKYNVYTRVLEPLNTPFAVEINGNLICAEPWIPNYLDINDPVTHEEIYGVRDFANSIDTNILNQYKGIALDDFYNVIHHDLYFSIRDFKWLLYEIRHNNQIINLLTYLETYFNISDIKEWDKLEYKDQLHWIDQKNFLAAIYQNNQNPNDRLLIFNILLFFEYKYSKRLLIQNYIRLPLSSNDRLPDDQLLDIIDQESYLNYNNIRVNQLLESWNSLESETLYNFLQEVFNEFKKTWYGYRIITKKERTLQFNNQPVIITTQNNRHTLSYKNIYNWAKSILFFMIEASILHLNVLTGNSNTDPQINMLHLKSIKEYTWNSYHYRIQYLFINQAISQYISVIINFSNVIRNTYIDISDSEIAVILEQIDREIKKNLRDIVFEALILRGLLSHYYINRDFTDKRFLDKNIKKEKIMQQNLIKKHIIIPNLKEYKACYYYLTNQPYGDLEKFFIKNNKPIDYILNLFEKGNNWYLMYAMDWISQIAFYHKFINKQVVLITGGTGVGKTSQVPKLLLYSIKMIYFRRKGSVLATVPRTNIAVDSANFMADSLGVPIKVFNKELKKTIKTFANYVQYKTKKDSHDFDTNAADYFVKIVTDGTLLEEMYKNPLLKKQFISDEDQGRYGAENECEYLVQNKYDILFIDESHEHNKNMDLILSLLKYTLYFNNSIKLVISSATMDDDEPIYRRYYKGLNDNHIFPLCFSNFGIGYKNNDDIICLDRIVIDGRVHISPPGETTQYKITEHYLIKDTENYDEAEKQGFDKLKQLFSNRVSGDILFFSVTKPRINSLVDTINKISPINIIAIPYYSDLPPKFSNLDNFIANLNKFDINKLDVISVITNNITGRKVTPGTYNQVVIVATNIAEASITINSLKHVIETGYFNNVKYDPDTDKSSPALDKISEASRLQRKGRVGRVSNGDVYYMYAQGSREDIKPNYKICIEDFKYDMIKLYRKNSNETNYIDYYFHDINNLYKIANFRININRFYNTIILPVTNYNYTLRARRRLLQNTKQEDEFRIVMDQIYKIDPLIWYNRSLFETVFYHTGNEFVSYQVIKNAVALNNNYNFDIPLPRLLTGYPITSIFDIIGNFYIIHPSENYLRRDLLTGIILDSRYSELYRMKYIINMVNFYNNLLTTNAIIPNATNQVVAKIEIFDRRQIQLVNDSNYSDITYYNFSNLKNPYNKYDDILEKTEFFNIIVFLDTRLDLEGLFNLDSSLKYQCIVSLMYSYLYDCLDEIIFIIASLCVTKLELKKWIKPTVNRNNKIRYSYEKLPWRIFGNNYGDLISIYYIYNSLKKYTGLEKYINKIILKDTIKDASIKRKYDLSVKEYNKINKKDLRSKFDCNLKLDFFEKLQQLDNKNKLNDTGLKEFKLLFIEKTEELDIDEMNILKQWADNYNINYDTILSIIKIHSRLSTLVKEEDKERQFNWFKNNVSVFKSPIIEENIIKCFIHGFNTNIVLHDHKEKIFYRLRSPVIKTFNYKYIFKNFYGRSILDYSLYDFGKLLLYIGTDQNNQACFINNIKFEWLFECIIHIYNPYMLDYSNRRASTNLLINKLINEYSDKYLDHHIVNSRAQTNNLIQYYKLLKNKINELLNN